MNTHEASDIIQDLTFTFVSTLIKNTKSELKLPIKFMDIYIEACRERGHNENKEESNLEIRHRVRDNLLNNGYIFVDPMDVDSIYLTQRALNEFSNISNR